MKSKPVGIISSSNHDVSEQDGSHGDGKKCSGSRYILKLETTRFVDQLGCVVQEERSQGLLHLKD